VAILLFHSGIDAQLDTPARLGRERFPSRHYQAEGHFLLLEGAPFIIHQDAEDICKIPGWRLATPAEQNDYARSKKKAGLIVEEAQGAEDAEASPPEVPPAAPPAPATTMTSDTAPGGAKTKG
jgi:hypothetical protein